MKTHLRRQVVILGGGFAGLAAALRLARTPGFRRDFNVTLIDKNCYHLYHALLYEVATATYHIKPEDLEYLEGGVCIRLKSLGALVTKAQIDFLQASITGVDRAHRRIQLDGQPDVPYDELVVALGSQPSFFNVPGLPEHALTLHTIPDALRIRECVMDMLVQAGSRPCRIIIGGGGFTGVELAGELLNMVRAYQRRKTLNSGMISLTIVEAGAGLLGPLGPKIGEQARRRLASLGAAFEFKQPITRVTDTSVSLKDGRELPYDVLIWTGGIVANKLIANLGLPTGKRGQIEVEPSLRVSGQTDLWSAGDCAAAVDPTTGQPVPQTASQAVAAGTLVADNIIREIHQQPLQPFIPVQRGFVVPIGGTYAIAQRGSGAISGFIGWILRKAADWSYFRSIMSFRNALRVFLRGGRVYLKND